MAAPERDELARVVDLIADEARRYLASVDDRPLREPGADERADRFGGSLPKRGAGADAALRELLAGLDAHVASSGPRFFHFVIGGVTPASLGADWLQSTIDQNPGLWSASPLGARLADLSIRWLLELFGLPSSWGGALTTGATMANFTALLCARRWWGHVHGVDVDAEGLAALPAMPVLTSGYVHASSRKALGMLGIGRNQVQTFSRDAAGRADLRAMREALATLGAPAILIANAGEVNAGDFDPIAEMADMAEEFGAWLHVDGAFGLFAALSPETRDLVEGVDRAHSVIADGHKWLNVPYESGFAFVRDASLLPAAFTSAAVYLTTLADRPNLAYVSPEMSQRARALPIWATLRAYGREGYRRMVERHLALTRRIASRVDEADDLERLADVRLNIATFRLHPPGMDDPSALDELNRRVGEAILEDGRVYVGTTRYEGKVCFRPAVVNWRTREEDVDLLVDVIRELGSVQRD